MLPDVPGLDDPVGGSNFRGFLTRMSLSTGATWVRLIKGGAGWRTDKLLS
jgi:hypothetical protein